MDTINLNMVEPTKYVIKENRNGTGGYEQMLRDMQKEKEEEDESASGLKKQYLDGLLKQCEMLSRTYYTAGSWNALMKVYAASKSVSIKESPSIKELNKVINSLSAALSELENEDKRKKGEDKEYKEGLPLVLNLSGAEKKLTIPVPSSSGEPVLIDVTL